MVLDALQAFKDDGECVIRRPGNAKDGDLANYLLYFTDQQSGGAELLTIGGPSGSEPFSSWLFVDRRILCREPCIYRMLASHGYTEPVGVQYMVSRGKDMLGQ